MGRRARASDLTRWGCRISSASERPDAFFSLQVHTGIPGRPGTRVWYNQNGPARATKRGGSIRAMSRDCAACRQQNPPHAQFCARCGRLLPSGDAAPPATGMRNLGVLAAVLAVIVSAAIVFGIAGNARRYTPLSRSTVSTRTTYPLPPDKAEALYELLAPRDVRVRVSKTAHGISIAATEREKQILDRFVELVTRLDGHDDTCIDDQMAKARPTWTASERYMLTKGKVTTLVRILGFADVPVLVTPGRSAVEVDATPADQETIRGVVNILRGRRRP